MILHYLFLASGAAHWNSPPASKVGVALMLLYLTQALN